MNAPAKDCDHRRIEDFLDSNCVGLKDEQLLEHLNTCTACREQMETRAADLDSWNCAGKLLQPGEFDHASFDEYSLATAGAGPVDPPVAIQSVLDLLLPSEEPSRLGRLGTYEVSGVIGVGGMGVVLKAVDPALDRVVAIKVLAPHLAHSGTARRRFAREAKAAAAVLHPNVIPIYSVSSDERTPYLVMAYVRGGSVQKRIDREGPLSTVEILRIGSQVAAGLAAAHEQGLVHRDVKPENILLEEGVERITLTDFGLARAVDDASATQPGVIAGTPQYMSPEQTRGEPIDQQSDLFSLGCVLYALCTGRPPFRADSSYAVMRKVSDDLPLPIRELNPEIPDWLCAVIGKLMAKRKAERFASAHEVHGLLETCLSHVQQPATYPLPKNLPHPRPRRRWTPIAKTFFGVSSMLAIATAIYLLSALFTDTPPSGRASSAANRAALDEPDPSELAVDKRTPQEATQPPAPAHADGDAPLTWKALLGTEPPEGYPVDPLTLIQALNNSRGEWSFAGKIKRGAAESEFEASLAIQGGFQEMIRQDAFPQWQVVIAWPPVEPTDSLVLHIMALPEPTGLRWMLAPQYATNRGTPVRGDFPMYEGAWNSETATIVWTSKQLQSPLKQDDPKPKPEQQAAPPSTFQMVVKKNGEIAVRGYRHNDALSFWGQSAARIGEPYVEKGPAIPKLPGGYRIFFASRLEVYLEAPGQFEGAGPRIEKIGCDGKYIFGLVAAHPKLRSDEAPGYFWLDSETGEIAKGMDIAAWLAALKSKGIGEPRLFGPAEVGER